MLAGCYAMAMSKMTHNDLHEGNTFIVDHGEPAKMTYIYGGVIYSFDTQYKPLIFDFDRAYVKSEGPNPILDDDYLCDHASQCNEFVPNADMVKILCYLYKVTPSMRENIKRCLVKEGSDFTNHKLNNVLSNSNGCFFQEDDDEDAHSMSSEEYAKLNDPDTILNKWGVLYNLVGGDGDIIAGNTTFACNSNMFDDDGKLIPEVAEDASLKMSNLQI
jgi:hypothetical protein